MLNKLENTIVSEGKASQDRYSKFTLWCVDRSKNFRFEIKTATQQAGELKATIDECNAKLESLSETINTLTTLIADSEKAVLTATVLRKKENDDFKAVEASVVSTCDTLRRAIAILKAEMRKQAGMSLLQTTRASNLEEALTSLVQAQQLSTADADDLKAFIQSSAAATDGDSDDEEDAASATPSPNSRNIVDVMKDLLSKAQNQLEAVRTQENKADLAFQSLKAAKELQVKHAVRDVAKAKTSLASTKEEKAKAQGALKVTLTDLKDDQKTLAGVHKDCMDAAATFQEETKARTAEMKALATATKIIKETTSGADARTYTSSSFLQVRMSSAGLRKNIEVLKLLRSRARASPSPALNQLVAEISGAIHESDRNGANPFAKVKNLISEMIKKLDDEGYGEAKKKKYCDMELANSQEQNKNKADKVTKLNNKLDGVSAQISKLADELAVLQQEISDLMASQAKMDLLRQDGHAAYKASKKDLEQGMAGIQLALKVLKDYYSTGAKGSAAGNIIGLLEVAEGDITTSLTEQAADEKTAQADYVKQSRENEVSKAAKTELMKLKSKTKTELESNKPSVITDRNGEQEQLNAILDYRRKIEAECIAKPETYESRAKRREQQISDLKGALQSLDSDSVDGVFLQLSSSRHALRGQARLEP